MASKDLTGQRFGMLTVLGPTEKRKYGDTVWECKCDCGNVIERATRLLKASKCASCGCWRKSGRAGSPNKRTRSPYNDLTGKRFGRLTIIGPTDKRKRGNIVWECKCDCGNTAERSTDQLRASPCPSCGCYAKEVRKKEAEARAIDITGQRFGLLTVVGKSDRRNSGGDVLWECKCDCGNTCYVIKGSLTRGGTKSCGCLCAKRQKEVTPAKAKARGLVDGTSLRALTKATPKHSKTGVKGVCPVQGNKYQAYICIKGKSTVLGTFATVEEAAEARRQAEVELFDPVLKEHGWKTTGESGQ